MAQVPPLSVAVPNPPSWVLAVSIAVAIAAAGGLVAASAYYGSAPQQGPHLTIRPGAIAPSTWPCNRMNYSAINASVREGGPTDPGSERNYTLYATWEEAAWATICQDPTFVALLVAHGNDSLYWSGGSSGLNTVNGSLNADIGSSWLTPGGGSREYEIWIATYPSLNVPGPVTSSSPVVSMGGIEDRAGVWESLL
jgi:hypothetical protein